MVLLGSDGIGLRRCHRLGRKLAPDCTRRRQPNNANLSCFDMLILGLTGWKSVRRCVSGVDDMNYTPWTSHCVSKCSLYRPSSY